MRHFWSSTALLLLASCGSGPPTTPGWAVEESPAQQQVHTPPSSGLWGERAEEFVWHPAAESTQTRAQWEQYENWGGDYLTPDGRTRFEYVFEFKMLATELGIRNADYEHKRWVGVGAPFSKAGTVQMYECGHLHASIYMVDDHLMVDCRESGKLRMVLISTTPVPVTAEPQLPSPFGELVQSTFDAGAWARPVIEYFTIIGGEPIEIASVLERRRTIPPSYILIHLAPESQYMRWHRVEPVGLHP